MEWVALCDWLLVSDLCLGLGRTALGLGWLLVLVAGLGPFPWAGGETPLGLGGLLVLVTGLGPLPWASGKAHGLSGFFVRDLFGTISLGWRKQPGWFVNVVDWFGTHALGWGKQPLAWMC